jgi:hypothetical protein
MIVRFLPSMMLHLVSSGDSSAAGCLKLSQLGIMSDLLERYRVFSVKVASSETIGYMKKAIKDAKKNAFNDLDANLNIWNASNHGLHIRPFDRDDQSKRCHPW